MAILIDGKKVAKEILENLADETVFIGVSVANITDYPTLDFLVSGILFHLPPEQYFLRDPSWSAGYQLGIWKWDNVVCLTPN